MDTQLGWMKDGNVACKATVDVFIPMDEVIKALVGSEQLAYILNRLGTIFDNEMDQCWSVKELDENGKKFVGKMQYFVQKPSFSDALEAIINTYPNLDETQPCVINARKALS